MDGETNALPTARHSRGSREELATAALRRYRNGGFTAVSFRQIARDTGISHMQPYRFFRNKADLLAAMRCQCFRELLDVICQADRPEGLPVARLYAITTGAFTHLFARPADYRLMFAMNQPSPREFPELLDARQRVYDHLHSVVQAGVDRGELHGDSDDVLHLAWAVSHGLFTLHVSEQLIHGRALDALIQPALNVMFAPFRDPEDVQSLRDAARRLPDSPIQKEDSDEQPDA